VGTIWALNGRRGRSMGMGRTWEWSWA